MRGEPSGNHGKGRAAFQGGIHPAFENEQIRRGLQPCPEDRLAALRENSQPPHPQKKTTGPHGPERRPDPGNILFRHIADETQGQVEIVSRRPRDSGKFRLQGLQAGQKILGQFQGNEQPLRFPLAERFHFICFRKHGRLLATAAFTSCGRPCSLLTARPRD